MPIIDMKRGYPWGWKQGDPEPAPEDFSENWYFWCPACEGLHSYRTKLAKGEGGPLWTFNGNTEKPSFQASLLYKSIGCHLYVTDGKIVYVGDCKHTYAGKTIDMVPLPFAI